ncbi:protein arginine kinase [Sedimentibacter sp. MB31-C6]|uniref:protein arginine kinase n=1 Tax=Sedimentibacter sp. MB31-C6 TaxID=3109366 RepID=UPI002DDD54B1|nr:protein arginine kinase [Sedimentibacter sp. MB36-C1]WSI03338.1 protein arginine kinase [Sedimentibacter sp. MB36-C1]
MDYNDIVVTSRIRLARNLKNYKFPTKMSNEESNKIINDVNDAINSIGLNYKLTYMKDLSETEKNVLVERHLISPGLGEKKNDGAFLLSPDESVSIMINEEDHVRIQSLGQNMSLMECWDISNKIDDVLEEKLDYTFDKDLGYITSCPTNLGTGMRASVMMHLPALSITNQIDKLIYGVSQLGVAVRGVYGEGTKSLGHLYQISNQGTLGASEETLIDKVTQITMQIAQKEKHTRDYLNKNNIDELEDEIYRAYGLLTNAKKMTTDEAMKLLSLIKLGSEMKIIDKVKNKKLYELMIKIQPNNLLSKEGKDLTAKERDFKRAELISRELLS